MERLMRFLKQPRVAEIGLIFLAPFMGMAKAYITNYARLRTLNRA